MGQSPHDPNRRHPYVSSVTIRSRFFALTYDRLMTRVELAGLRAQRVALITRATGRVLEIGAGTGANLALYGSAVESLTLTEPEIPMLHRLERRVHAQMPATKVFRAPAEDLPFDDDTFDVAVSTLVLCGVSDQPRALRELHRVLRPGGELLFIEHVRSDEARLARVQDRLNGLNRFVAGCECNRPTLHSIRASGFEVIDVEHSALSKAPPFVRPLIVGAAKTIPGRRFQDPTDHEADVS
jgi:ubiquinone/menaquinone biosynthesis C-methylase UbiE